MAPGTWTRATRVSRRPIASSVGGLAREGGRGHVLDRALADALLEVADGGVELRVLPVEGRPGEVVHDDVRIDAVALDQPLPLGPVDAGLRRGGDAVVEQEVVRAEPDLAAPGARA